MKYEVVPNSCRVCLRRSLKLRSIYKPLEEGEEPPHEMLRLIAGVTLEEADVNVELPKNICKNCALSLSLAFQFRMKALRTQRIIELYSNELNRSKESPPKNTEIVVKEELEEYVDLHESMAEDYANEDELSNVKDMKVEMLEMSFSDAEANETNEDLYEYEDSDCKVEYLDEAEPHEVDHTQSEKTPPTQREHEGNITSSRFYYDDSDLCQENESEHVSEDEAVQPLEIELEIGAKQSASSCLSVGRLVQGKQSSNSTGRTRVKQASSDGASTRNSRKIEDDAGHICDICGNIYAKRGRMMEHRRRHDKELRFACELCDKRFHLREKLRKHMFSHKGGKPYKCSQCSRTFFYESVKKAHEVVHSGIKPYVCEECNKAFAYAHALTKHKLIHADIKLYHCQYCDKDFRLQHHMKQHVETKLHQNAVRAAEETARSSKTPKHFPKPIASRSSNKSLV